MGSLDRVTVTPRAALTRGLSRRAALVAGVGGVLAACTSDADRDDTPALQRRIDSLARAGGGRVRLPDGELRVTGLHVRTGIDLVGGRETVLVGTSAKDVVSIARGSRRVRLSAFTIRLSDHGSNGIHAREGVDDLSLSEVGVHGQGRGFAVYLRTGAQKIVVRDCAFSQIGTGVRVLEGARSLEISNCRIDEWAERGISLKAVGPAGASKDIRLEGNTIGPCLPGGKVRQPVQFNAADGGYFDEVVVRKNHVRGSRADDKDDERSGTADLISLHHCRRFTVERNRVEGSGEVGLTVSRGSRRGTIVGNICVDNDSAGIVVGSKSGPVVDDVVVRGNQCRGNGMNHGGELPSTARSGIAVRNASDVRVHDNVLESGAGGRQGYGVTVAGSRRVTVTRNSFSGGSAQDVLRFVGRGDGEDL